MIIVVLGLFTAHIVACICLGAALTWLLGIKRKDAVSTSAGAELTTDLLLGQGAMASLWTLMALLGQFSPAAVAASLILATLVGIGFLWPELIRLPGYLSTLYLSLKTETLLWKLLAFLSLLVLLLGGAGALILPPTGDAAAFYMALPKMVAGSHHLKPLPGYEGFTQIGLQGELHYAALISLGSVGAAKLLVWLEASATAVLLLKIGAAAGLGRRGLIIALATLVSSTAFVILIPDGKVDLFGAAMGMAAFYWALRVEGPPLRSVALRLAGLFAGLAIIAKLSYIVPLIAGVALIITLRYAPLLKERDEGQRGGGARYAWPQALAALCVLGLWMLLPAVPHSIKNGMLFHEPLAPLINFRTKSFIEQTWFSPEVTRRIVLTYPLGLIFGEYPMQGGALSPLLLAFAPFLFISRKGRAILQGPLLQITLSAAAGTVLWVIARPSV
ncbi:MAG: hypothetical protein M3362_10450, partial [Acidobacteriota bacterium]|nr:hypothetical protein [Acidobacteriota bacterium]